MSVFLYHFVFSDMKSVDDVAFPEIIKELKSLVLGFKTLSWLYGPV